MKQTRGVVRLVDEVLGASSIGAYLHGSAVLGGLKPASDIDVLVVTRHSLDHRQRHALITGLRGLSGAPPGLRPVELTVVVQSQVRPWRYPPVVDLLYGEWLRAAFADGGVPKPEPMPDLAVLITMVLAADHPIVGPPPAQVLDPVPHQDLLAASVAGIPGLLDDLAADARDVVLTLARVWCTLATGEIRSKDAAAQWAIARLPFDHRPVLRHARALYLGCRYDEERWSDELRARLRPHIDHVLAEIYNCHTAPDGRS